MSTWLIQTNLIANDQLVKLGHAVVDLKIPFEECIVIPFDDTPLKIQSEDKVIIPYGSTRLTKSAKIAGLKGLYFDEPQFRSDVWSANRNDMLNADALILTIENAYKFMDENTSEDPWFIRPVNDLKAFSGCLIDRNQFRSWIDGASHGGYTFDDMQEIVIAKPKKIKAEWRYFIVDHKIVDGSLYNVNGRLFKEHVTEKDVIEEAQKFADLWTPDDVVCMDLALTHDGLKVIEFNCFNSTGWYDHNISAVVKAVTEYTDKTRY